MKKKYVALLLSSFLMTTYSCKEQDKQPTYGTKEYQQAQKESSKQAHIQLLDVHKIKQLTEINQELVILDVRTPTEYHKGHINNAQNVNFHGRFEQKMNQLDKTKPYLVYCQRGGRSNSAAEMMIKAGFQQVYDMKGGFTQWNAAGLPYKM